MRYLSLGQLLQLHHRILEQSGGAPGILHPAVLESSLRQPRMTFGGKDLYPTLAEKAAVLGFTIIRNHPFRDGNKRTGHAVMEVFLLLNGHEIIASVDDAERIILGVASGDINREEFTAWVVEKMHPVEE